jgi:hypothetical protein
MPAFDGARHGVFICKAGVVQDKHSRCKVSQRGKCEKDKSNVKRCSQTSKAKGDRQTYEK